MKKPISLSAQKRASLASQQTADRRRILWMTAALIVLGVGAAYSAFQAKTYRESEKDVLPSEPLPTETVAIPEIDAERWSELVSDATPDDRVVLERAALEEALPVARELRRAHVEELGAEELAGESDLTPLLEAPEDVRGRAYFARGWIESLRVRRDADGEVVEARGRLSLEGGGTVYFASPQLEGGIDEGDFVRVDGLFLKAFSDEDPERPGTWREGPLLVTRSPEHSYAGLGVVERLPPRLFETVRDDSAKEGETGIDPVAKWTLMAHARDLAPDAIDWESAPELDNATISRVLLDGESHRAQPFRMPIGQLMGVRVRKTGENPARMEYITEGWIGNWTWKGGAPVAMFWAPGARHDLKERDLVRGTCFFVKNRTYEPRDGGIALAPWFAMHTLERFVPPEDESVGTIFAAVIAMVALLTVTLFFLVARDRRASKKLHEDLTRRRRARRDQPAPSAQ